MRKPVQRILNELHYLRFSVSAYNQYFDGTSWYRVYKTGEVDRTTYADVSWVEDANTIPDIAARCPLSSEKKLCDWMDEKNIPYDRVLQEYKVETLGWTIRFTPVKDGANSYSISMSKTVGSIRFGQNSWRTPD